MYASNFNTQDGNTDGRVASVGIPKIVKAPDKEGIPYKVGDWAPSSVHFTVGYDSTYQTAGKINFQNLLSSFDITIYDADDTTVISTFSTLVDYTAFLTNSSWEFDRTSSDGYIRIYISEWEEYLNVGLTPRYKARVQIFIYNTTFLPNGGRFRVVINHNTSVEKDSVLVDTVFTKDQTLFYNPQETTLAFIPKDLQSQPIYPYIAEVIDWVVDTYHTGELNKIYALYNVEHPDFDPDYILELFDFPYAALFGNTLTEDMKKSLAFFLSRLYQLKGTRKGLEYIFHLLDLHVKVYEWFEINERHERGEAFYYRNAEPCSIWIDFGVVGNYPISDEWEAKLISLVNLLLWICVKIDEIVWTKIFIDYVDHDDYETEILADWEISEYSPYKANCEILVYGMAIHPDLPRYGDGHIYTLDYVFRYYKDSDYVEVNYDGSNTHTGKYGRHVDRSEPWYFSSDTELTVGCWYKYRDVPRVTMPLVFGNLLKFDHIIPGTRLYGACDVSIITNEIFTVLEEDYAIGEGFFYGHGSVYDGGRTYQEKVFDDTFISQELAFEYQLDLPQEEFTAELTMDGFEDNIFPLLRPTLVGECIVNRSKYFGELYFSNELTDNTETSIASELRINGIFYGSKGLVYSTLSFGTNIFVGNDIVGSSDNHYGTDVTVASFLTAYIQELYDITFNLIKGPTEAKWKIEGMSDWLDFGVPVELEQGVYNIVFSPDSDWLTPATFTVVANKNNAIDVEYGML